MNIFNVLFTYLEIKKFLALIFLMKDEKPIEGMEEATTMFKAATARLEELEKSIASIKSTLTKLEKTLLEEDTTKNV